MTRAIGEEKAAVHVLRCGAKDYVTKDKLGTLPQVIERVDDSVAELAAPAGAPTNELHDGYPGG